MAAPFRLSICNEVFENQPFDRVAINVRELGYDGLEIAPFTLAESPEFITPSQRSEYRRILSDSGLAFVGLHWLMVSPAGLQVTTPDRSLRARSWQHIRHLIDLCADLGDGGVMVFGSPKQRSTVGGVTPTEARRIFINELAEVAPQAQERGVRILVEALPSNQSDVINTLDEAVAVVEAIHNPSVKTMFDTHNAVDEKAPHSEVIQKNTRHIAHIHVNEIDGTEPGHGNYDFGALFATLQQVGYDGWVSVEVFDFSRNPKEIAAGAIHHLRVSMEEASRKVAGVAP